MRCWVLTGNSWKEEANDLVVLELESSLDFFFLEIISSAVADLAFRFKDSPFSTLSTVVCFVFVF